MTAQSNTMLPIGRNFDIAAGLTAVIDVALKDNAGNDLDITKISDSSWKMQPTVFDATGAVEKTFNSGITFEVINSTVYAHIVIDAGNSIGLPGSSEYVTWNHRLQITYSGLPYLAFMGQAKIWKVI